MKSSIYDTNHIIYNKLFVAENVAFQAESTVVENSYRCFERYIVSS